MDVAVDVKVLKVEEDSSSEGEVKSRSESVVKSSESKYGFSVVKSSKESPEEPSGEVVVEIVLLVEDSDVDVAVVLVVDVAVELVDVGIVVEDIGASVEEVMFIG